MLHEESNAKSTHARQQSAKDRSYSRQSSAESSDSRRRLVMYPKVASLNSEPHSEDLEKDFTDHALAKTASDRRMETAYSQEQQPASTSIGGKKLNSKNQGFVPTAPVVPFSPDRSPVSPQTLQMPLFVTPPLPLAPLVPYASTVPIVALQNVELVAVHSGRHRCNESANNRKMCLYNYGVLAEPAISIAGRNTQLGLYNLGTLLPVAVSSESRLG